MKGVKEIALSHFPKSSSPSSINNDDPPKIALHCIGNREIWNQHVGLFVIILYHSADMKCMLVSSNNPFFNLESGSISLNLNFLEADDVNTFFTFDKRRNLLSLKLTTKKKLFFFKMDNSQPGFS